MVKQSKKEEWTSSLTNTQNLYKKTGEGLKKEENQEKSQKVKKEINHRIQGNLQNSQQLINTNINKSTQQSQNNSETSISKSQQSKKKEESSKSQKANKKDKKSKKEKNELNDKKEKKEKKQKKEKNQKSTVKSKKQAKQKIQSRKTARASELMGGTKFVKEFLERMKISQKKNKKIDTVKKCVDKVDRIDRIRGVQIIYPRYIIPIKSKFKVIWDIIILFLIMYIAVMLPFQIGFRYEGGALYTIEWIIIAIFIIDIGMNTRTTYLNSDGDEILESKKILYHYLKSINFIVDILSAIPIAEFFESNNNIRLINLIKILRLLRLARLLKLLQSDKVKYFALFMKSFIGFLIILHWITCTWFLISQADYDSETSGFVTTWVPSSIRGVAESSNTDEQELVDSFYSTYSKGEQYITSLYSITMLVLGGDIAPANKKQAFTLSIACIIGQTSLAILFANISVLIFKMNQKSAEYQLQLETLQNTLQTTELASDLKSRILEYFQYCWRKKKPEISNFSDLSITLEREMLLVIHQKIVANVPLFSGLELSELLSIIQKLKTQVYMPNETIYRTNDISNEMFFISEGIIEQITYQIQDDDDDDESILLKQIKHRDSHAIKQKVENYSKKGKKETKIYQTEHQAIVMQPQIETGRIEDEELLGTESTNRLNQRPIEKRNIFSNFQNQKQQNQQQQNKDVQLLKQGDYFLELSLINSMRVESDYNSSVFSIVQSFTRKDFEQLKREFPGIQSRLQKGLDHYKCKQKSVLGEILSKVKK
ncbi:Cyclic nucleotide-binding protein [Pseudocohnilembus persalinus]|uniref:Cyclic nucleotide-binding protein n=1 Tax=Pseudocohnilembus persalinus TaxID=266149 RepID=A0A0V0R930_PSEPJ|nr:Cyclic nucleotide-binding protein [Pseudocohnilembus persalinus]|eukprot:KRX11005.1 Cyclic nucleotide-binding protein [Pseudocohnilembus persalinus]